MDAKYQAALDYHKLPKKGKIEVISTKPCHTQSELSLAYSPGVAAPCLEIFRDPALAYDYTSKGNLVAVISNGTAVLGLGNLGPVASKPVMEGKGILFKRFADIDVFDIELACTRPDHFIETVAALAPTFGGINLEDVKAPECFEIEETLKKRLDIPVFHDDQHGTAIICSAALLNALELQDKKINQIKVVFNGSGASGISCAKMFLSFGVLPENLIMCDSQGVIYQGRQEGMNQYKEPFARNTHLRTLEEAMVGADVFVGCSVKGAVSKSMVASMAPRPIVFAMANPDPEISYEDATSVRDDLIMATGRSDYPNQVNNVMGFPYIFRGALDVRARTINEEMKRAAALAIAKLAKEKVITSVSKAYKGKTFSFGKDYIIPTPFDPRVLFWVAPAVAQAAMESGVARIHVDIKLYQEQLITMFNPSRLVFQEIADIARNNHPKIVFSEGEEPKIQEAALLLAKQEIAFPILLGHRDKIAQGLCQLGLEPHEYGIVETKNHPEIEKMSQELFALRQHKGMTLEKARQLVSEDPAYIGAFMVRSQKADIMLSGINMSYPQAIKPALEVLERRKGIERIYGIYLMIKGERLFIFADTTMHIQPTAQQLAEVTHLCAELAKRLRLTPRVAMLSFSQKGNVDHTESHLMQEATRLVKKQDPSLPIVGDIQANFAVNSRLIEENFPELGGTANILIFPNLAAGNISYKLLQEIGGFTAVGPILLGLEKSFAAIPHGASPTQVVYLALATAAEVSPASS